MSYNNHLQGAIPQGIGAAYPEQQTEQSEINYAANELDSATGVLSSLVDILINQIDPILKQNPPEKSGLNSIGRAVTSRFACGLIEQKSKVDNISDRVRNALDRLAL